MTMDSEVMMTVSLNGWAYPAKKLVTLSVPGANRRLTLNALCAPLLIAVAADYHATVRPIDVGTWDDGGYCDRNARAASSSKSNHANGTAIDLNWSEEGALGSAWGKKFFATAKAKLTVRAMKRRYGACIAWGGDWRALDYMHWEVKPGVTPDQVAALTLKLKIDKKGVRGA